MRKLIVFIVLLCCEKGVNYTVAAPINERKEESFNLSVQLVDRIRIPSKEKFKKSTIGGLSGLVFSNKSLFAVSDDRGRYGPPRFYEFELKKINQKFNILTKEVYELTSHKVERNSKHLDLESFIFYNGKWVFSSEGDLNSKPRTSPEILYIEESTLKKNLALENNVNFDGLKLFLELPQKFLPNKSGRLKKGLHNNMAFEGLTQNGDIIGLMSESYLIQDELNKDKISTENRIDSYLLFYNTKARKWTNEFHLNFSNYEKNFLYFGATELTHWKENKYFILTRGIKLSADLSYDCQLWLLDLDVSRKELLKGKVLHPKLVANFESMNLKENYEGMAIVNFEVTKENANNLNFDQQKKTSEEYLVVVSDDNFNSNEKTEFLFLKINELK